MRFLLVFLIACGSATPAAEPVISNAAAPDAAVAPPADAAVTMDFLGCCSQGHWTCGRTPEAGEICPTAAIPGCCQSGTWTCGRMPRPGECPRAFIP